MNNQEFHIKSYCRITNEKMICDGNLILKRNPDESNAEFLKEIYRKSEANYPKFFKMDLLCKSAFLAAEFISKKENLFETNTALILSNKGSSQDSDEKHAQAIYDENFAASPAVFVYTLPNIALGEISIRHQLFSENLFLIFDKFSPETLVPYSEQILNENNAEKVLAGWVEADENNLDVFIYLIEKELDTKEITKHTIENITNLYLKK